MRLQFAFECNQSGIPLDFTPPFSCFIDLEVDAKCILLLVAFSLCNTHERVEASNKLLVCDHFTSHPGMSDYISHHGSGRRPLLQEVLDEVFELRSEIEILVGEPELGCVATHQVSVMWVRLIGPLERVVQGAHREKHYSKGKDVDVLALVRRFMTILLGNNLWSHVNARPTVRPQEVTAISACEWNPVAEIDKFYLVVVRQNDVLGLDIAMGQTDLVQLVKSACNFAENVATVLII